MSIVTRIFLLIAVTLLLVAGVEFFNGVQLRNARLQELRSDTVQLARIAELDMVRILDGAHQLLSTLAKLPDENGWDKRACAIVEATASSDFEYDHLVGVDRNGIIQCSSSGTEFAGTRTPDIELFDRIVATAGFSVGSHGKGRASGNEVIRVGYPVVDAAGTVTGAVYAGINVTWLNTALSQWQLGEQAAIYIVDRNSIVIARHPNPSGVGQPIAESLRPFLSAAGLGTAEIPDASGTVQLYGYVPINGGLSGGLGVLVGRDPRHAFADINRLIWLNAAAVLAGLLLSAFLAVVYVRRFLTRPFQSLLTTAERWRDGDWSVSAGVKSGIPEFDRLATGFNGMAVAVNDRQQALQFNNLLLRTEVENSQDAILVVSPAAEIQLSNRRFADMWGIPPALIEARTDAPVFATIVAQVQDPVGFMARAQHLHKKPEEQSADELATRDGRIIDWHSTPLKTPDGHNLGRVSFFRDVTEKRRADMKLRDERDFTLTLLATLPGLFVIFDQEGHLVRWNENLSIVTGLSNEQLSGTDAFSLVVEGDREFARQKLTAAILDGHADIELGVRTKNGGMRKFRWSGRTLTRDGHPHFMTVGVDVTAARAAETRLRASEEALAEAQAIAHVGNWEIDQSTGRVTWSDEVFRIFGVDQRTFIPSYQAILERTHPEDRPSVGSTYVDAMAAVLNKQTQYVYSIDHRIVMDDGSIKFVSERGRMIYDDKDNPVRAVGTVQDITQRKLTEENLLRMARQDILTGLTNRTLFVEELERAIASARRDGKSFAVFYLDLDHFKDVNNTLGHPVGDLLLQVVAQRLQSAIRKTDIVARFGGDEFAIVDTNIGEPADAVVLADKVLKTLSEPFLIQGHEIRTGASVGIAIYGPEPSDSETLLSHADVALFRAKADGRGTYRFFTEAMDIEVRTRVEVTDELRKAITSGQLFLAYQPQVDVDTGQIIGVEALVRWRHPTRGIVAPDEFVPIAEKSGQIGPLGNWVLREACRQMKEWLDAGIAPPLIAVNVSGTQIQTPFEPEQGIAAILAETAVPPERLELELTETILMSLAGPHHDALHRLRKAGLRIAIDDFGTGYSSLEYLGHLPINRIKIAQSFTLDLTSNPRSATIMRAAIAMAHELELDVIVEGVETAEQLELVRSFGAHKVQGYYFSKPLPSGEMKALLRVGTISPARAVVTEAAAE